MMPRWIYPLCACLAVCALVPFALIARARESLSTRTRIQIIQDMCKQPKYLPQAPNPVFADGRAMRPAVEYAVARGDLEEDERYYKGIEGKSWVKKIPPSPDGQPPNYRQMLNRGQERFGIYCASCHGLGGYGDGQVDARATELAAAGEAAWTRPSNYHEEKYLSYDDGNFFNTITNGIRHMPPYGAQVPVADRWAIVAYIRALQRSQHATLKDVPPDKVDEVKALLEE